jgi:hypothetical protein
MYRLAKKYWFNDFNAYRNVAHDAEEKARQLKSRLDHASVPVDTCLREA